MVKVDKDVHFCSACLDVSDADPEYYFARRFKESAQGHTNRAAKLVCHLNREGAKTKWYKDGKAISVGLENEIPYTVYVAIKYHKK